MGSETRMERFMPRDTLPGFFRELAEMLENGGGNGMESIRAFRKMKITLEDTGTSVAVKVKFKAGEESGEAGVWIEEGHELPQYAVKKLLKYKDLKKRMKKSYKALFTVVHDGRMPEREIVEEFLRQSELMTSFPGYGDEYYDEYNEACAAFAAAYERGDMAVLHKAFDRLDQAKSHCHNRYK